jgi:hypothetical protein
MAKKRNRSNRPKPRSGSSAAKSPAAEASKSSESSSESSAESLSGTPDTGSDPKSDTRVPDTGSDPKSDTRTSSDIAASDSPDIPAFDKATARSKQRNKKKRAAKAAGEAHATRLATARQEKADRQQTREARDQLATQTRGKHAKSLPEARVAKHGAVPEPTFWFGFEVTWAKLSLARVVIFSLLAIDALLLVRHAPRYGANDFNVGQLAIFDGIGPGRIAYGGGQLLLAYLFVLVAFGVATRVLVPLCAVLYGWLYFGSQLDSYQHHYLVVLLLAIASFESWERPEGATAETRVASWPLRVMLVQLAIMYLWAAISKMHPAWVDGQTLAIQMSGSGVGGAIAKTIGFPVASVLVIVVELMLAATVWWKRGWLVAAPLGLLFHGGILMTNLEIGLFAALMLGIYILVVPDAIWVWIAEAPVVVSLRESTRALAEKRCWAIFGGTLLFGLGVAWLVRLEGGLVVALVAAIIPVVHAVRAAMRATQPRAMVGIAHAAAIVLWLLVDRASTVAVDYYRYWGGSQRRLENFEQAERAYRSMVDIAPDDPVGHYQLGRILVTRPGVGDSSRVDEGLSRLRRAQQLEPTRARAFVEEARVLASQGHTAEALVKAKEGAVAEPSDPEARAIVDSLSMSQPAPAPAPDSEP